MNCARCGKDEGEMALMGGRRYHLAGCEMTVVTEFDLGVILGTYDRMMNSPTRGEMAANETEVVGLMKQFLPRLVEEIRHHRGMKGIPR